MTKPTNLRKAASSAPVAKVDIMGSLAWANVLALMAWPKEARRQQHVVATYAADMFGFLGRLDSHAAAVGETLALQDAVSSLGTHAEELSFMPGTKALFERMVRSPREVVSDVTSQLWAPAGGFKSVADATGTDLILREFTNASTGGAMHAGYMLALVAIMKERHPELVPSLARLIHRIGLNHAKSA
jgi:hypothetical protein